VRKKLSLAKRKIKRASTALLHSNKIECVGSNGKIKMKISKAGIGNALGQMH